MAIFEKKPSIICGKRGCPLPTKTVIQGSQGPVQCFLYSHGWQRSASWSKSTVKRILWPRRRIFKAWPGTLPCMWAAIKSALRACRRNPGGNAGTRESHLREQLTAEKKPEKIWDKIIEGKLKKYNEEGVSRRSEVH